MVYNTYILAKLYSTLPKLFKIKLLSIINGLFNENGILLSIAC